MDGSTNDAAVTTDHLSIEEVDVITLISADGTTAGYHEQPPTSGS